MAKKAKEAKEAKQCPICKMEVDSKAETCPGCAAVFDDSPIGATAPTPDPIQEAIDNPVELNEAQKAAMLPDDEAAPNGDADTEENTTA